MDLDALRNECRKRYGVAATDNLFTDSDLALLINASIRRLNADMDWPWLEVEATANTTIDNNVLTLAADVRRVQFMSYQNQEVRYLSRRAQPDFYTAKGAPRWYSYEGNVWKIFPTPNAVYTVDYNYIRTVEPTLSAGTDTPLTPDYAIDAVISWAMVIMARRERELDLERNFYGEYARTMDMLRDEARKTTEGMSPRRTRVEDKMATSFPGS